jgi:hypothetical protein
MRRRRPMQRWSGREHGLSVDPSVPLWTVESYDIAWGPRTGERQRAITLEGNDGPWTTAISALLSGDPLTHCVLDDTRNSANFEITNTILRRS